MSLKFEYNTFTLKPYEKTFIYSILPEIIDIVLICVFATSGTSRSSSSCSSRAHICDLFHSTRQGKTWVEANIISLLSCVCNICVRVSECTPLEGFLRGKFLRRKFP